MPGQKHQPATAQQVCRQTPPPCYDRGGSKRAASLQAQRPKRRCELIAARVARAVALWQQRRHEIWSGHDAARLL
eukprot:6419733-Pyramimonas_sp.AAC.1